MKILVIDNEDNIRTGLVNMVSRYCPTISRITEANSMKAGLEALEKETPDLLFLDVELGDGTGMELLSKLKEIKFEIIFITAHNKYAIDAFKFSAIDFLLKPIEVTDLVLAVNKAEKNLKNKHIEMQLKILQENMSGAGSNERKIALRDAESIYFVKINDIIYCTADGSYTDFYLTENRKITISLKLKEYETILESYGFERPHHSYLVNIRRIDRFDKNDGGMLVMENNALIPVSQRKKSVIQDIISKL